MSSRLIFLALIVKSYAELFPTAYDPALFCSGIVDYDYYLDGSVNATSLNSLAISFAIEDWAFLSTPCKSNLKRLVCAQVYLPTNTSGVLPYKRPCRYNINWHMLI